MAEHTPTGILWLPRFAYQRSKKTGKWTTDSVCACWVVWLKDPNAGIASLDDRSIIDPISRPRSAEMSLWWCDNCKSIHPNGNYHCPTCGTPMVFATLEPAQSVAAVDPHLQSEGTPSTRVGGSSSFVDSSAAPAPRSPQQDQCSCGSPMSGQTGICSQCIAERKQRLSSSSSSSASPRTQEQEPTDNS